MAESWTAGDVEVWLVAAFRAMPYAGVFAPSARASTLRTAAGETPSATFDILAFSGTVLGERSPERRALLFWARLRATRGEMGESVAEFCREMRWPRSTFELRRRRACERVAAAKNAAAGRDVG